MKASRLFLLTTLACIPVLLFMRRPKSQSLASSDAELAQYNVPAPPVVIKLPAGWDYLPQKQVTTPIINFANKVLHDNGKNYGFFEQTTIDGTVVGAIVEPHYDNHVSSNLKWHPGVSILHKVTA